MTLVLSIPILLLTILGHTHGFGPAYAGDEFLRLKEIPPAVVAARTSGSVTLACSVTGSPTPIVAWYKGGKRQASGRHVSITTQLNVVHHSPHTGCRPRDRSGGPPTITGWHSTVMVNSGETARLSCSVQDSAEKHSVIWRNAAGEEVEEEGRFKLQGTDLLISQASWADMGRFTCTAQNGFGV